MRRNHVLALGFGLFLSLGSYTFFATPTHADGITGSASTSDTTWFGGTVWNASETRWEALPDSVWTFDSGTGSSFNHALPYVDPNKDPSIHATMEGWIGLDVRRGPKNSQWRIVDALDPRWDPATCLTTLTDNAAWIGLFADEADSLCYPNRQGHGSYWAWMLSKEFWYSSGDLTIALDYEIDSEWGDLSVRVSWDGSWRPVAGAGGTTNGQINWTWSPPDNRLIRVEIRFESGEESDEDGTSDSSCGGVAVDNIQLTGAITDFTDFESGWNGWTEGPIPPRTSRENGDWSQLAHISDLEPIAAPGPCGVADSVLFFANHEDPSWVHSYDQWNLALSPWIDLTAAGFTGDQVSTIEFDYYIDSIYHNYQYSWVGLEWFPDTSYVPGIECPNFLPTWFGVGTVGWYNPTCTGPDSPFVVDAAGTVPAHAERVRVAIGAWSLNYLYNYYPSEKSSPWVDNLRVGIVTSSTVSIPPTTPSPVVRAYPNPVRSGHPVQFTLANPTKDFKLHVFDLAGRQVAVWQVGREATHRAVDKAGRPLASGLYHLRWESSSGPVSTKLLVLR